MWRLAENDGKFQLWFSDGKPINALRGGHGVSSRLIVEGQGFLDLTEIKITEMTMLDANNSVLWPYPTPEYWFFPGNPSNGKTAPWLELAVEIVEDCCFIVRLIPNPTYESRINAAGKVINILSVPSSSLLGHRPLRFNHTGVRKTQAIAKIVR
jgi:hypothetical protein